MKQIIGISLGSSRQSSEDIIKVDSQEFRLTQTGADFDILVFRRLIR